MLKGPEYYRQFGSLTFTDNIKNFDEHRNFQNLEVELRNPKSHNFVIDYGDDEAWCGFNLDGNSISKLLKSEVGNVSLYMMRYTHIVAGL